MSCELCGRDCHCRPGLIDGVKMMLCPDCLRHGQGIQPVNTPSPHGDRAGNQHIRKPKPKDVFKKMEKELVSNWSEVIKEARVKKGLSREELGFKIEERTVTISKIENGDLRPPDKLIEKLEKELGIVLLEEVKEVAPTQHSSKGLTLGDFIKYEE